MILLAWCPISIFRFGWDFNRLDPRTPGLNMMGQRLPETNPPYRSLGLHFRPQVVELLFTSPCWFFSYTATIPNIKKPNGIERDRKISLHDSGVATLSRDVKSKLVQVPSPNQIDADLKV